jgi:hypothetical protein
VFELAAGSMLLILGILVIKPILAKNYRAMKGSIESVGIQNHVENKGEIHTHSHTHTSGHIHKSVLTGVLQGLARKRSNNAGNINNGKFYRDRTYLHISFWRVYYSGHGLHFMPNWILAKTYGFAFRKNP